MELQRVGHYWAQTHTHTCDIQKNHPVNVWGRVASGRLCGLREAHSHTGTNQGNLGVRGGENNGTDFMSGYYTEWSKPER